MSAALCITCGSFTATCGPQCESCAMPPRIPVSSEVARLNDEVARLVAALVHYDLWFGDECPCDDDPCPIASWAGAVVVTPEPPK